MKLIIKTGIAIIGILAMTLPSFVFANTGYGGGGGGGGSSGGSGWVDPRCYMPVNPPAGGFRFWGVQGHDVYNPGVQFDIDGGDASYMMISDKPDFEGAVMEPYSKAKAFQLSQGYGSKMVYARFFNYCKIPTNIFSWWFNYRFRHVLGEQIYGEGTLLRGTDNKVYVVKGGKLVYLSGPSALNKYVGQEILNVEDAVIESFSATGSGQAVLGTQTYANGTLLRGEDRTKVYVLKAGKKVLILNLEELAKYYLGKPILNVTDEVLARY